MRISAVWIALQTLNVLKWPCLGNARFSRACLARSRRGFAETDGARRTRPCQQLAQNATMAIFLSLKRGTYADLQYQECSARFCVISIFLPFRSRPFKLRSRQLPLPTSGPQTEAEQASEIEQAFRSQVAHAQRSRTPSRLLVLIKPPHHQIGASGLENHMSFIW